MQKWIWEGWKGCGTCKEHVQTPGLWHGKELRRWRVKSLCPLCSCSFVQCEKLIGEISKAITTFNWANSSGAVTAVSRGTLLNVHFFFILSHMLLLILQISSLSLWHLTPLRVRCQQPGLDYYLQLHVSHADRLFWCLIICAAVFYSRVCTLHFILFVFCLKSVHFPKKFLCGCCRETTWLILTFNRAKRTYWHMSGQLIPKYLWNCVAFKLLLMTNFFVII